MPVDSDPIQSSGRPDDFTSVLVDGLSSIQYKLLFFLFLLFLIITSDVFVNRILTQFSGAVDYKYPTNYGVVLQGMAMVFFFELINIGVEQKII